MEKENKSIIAFGAHPDDVEFGCGGTLLLLKELGYDIRIVDLTRGEAAAFGAGERLREAEEASAILGIPREIFDFGDGKISLSEEHIGKMKEILEGSKPIFAFAPYFKDKHPDHANTAKLVSMLCPTIHYFISDVENENLGVDISDIYEKKIEALDAHASQTRPGDVEWTEERHESYGKRLGVSRGELFFLEKDISLPHIFVRL